MEARFKVSLADPRFRAVDISDESWRIEYLIRWMLDKKHSVTVVLVTSWDTRYDPTSDEERHLQILYKCSSPLMRRLNLFLSFLMAADGGLLDAS